jgi:hypothetical protein
MVNRRRRVYHAVGRIDKNRERDALPTDWKFIRIAADRARSTLSAPMAGAKRTPSRRDHR